MAVITNPFTGQKLSNLTVDGVMNLALKVAESRFAGAGITSKYPELERGHSATETGRDQLRPPTRTRPRFTSRNGLKSATRSSGAGLTHRRSSRVKCSLTLLSPPQ